MNILYITHCDPRRTDFGSAQRTHLLWKALKQKGVVYTLFAVGPLSPVVDDEVERIKSFVFAPKGWVLIHLYAWLSHWLAPAEWPFRLSSLKKRLPWNDIKFDKVVVRYLNGVSRSQAWKLGDAFVDIDDLPIESFNTVARKRWPKALGWMGALVVAWWQKNLLKKCRGAWIASPAQVDQIEPYCPCKALPNLAMPVSPSYQINGPQRRQLMTIGLMSYAPNYEGVDWFVDNVWPLVYARCPDLTYAICGGGVSEEHKSRWSAIPGVDVRGFVKDVDLLYQESIGVVAPIMSGAGTCIKVIEAALHGRKIFASPFALRGMSCDDKGRLCISEISEAREFAVAIVDFAGASGLRTRIQQAIADEAVRLNSFEEFSDRIWAVLGQTSSSVECY